MSDTSTSNIICYLFIKLMLKKNPKYYGPKVKPTLKQIPGQQNLSCGKREAEKKYKGA